jgi:hypothetical protein
VSDGLVTRMLEAVGRAVHRLVHPQHRQEQERLDRLVRALETRETTQADLLRKQFDGLADKVARLALDRDVRGLHRDVTELRAATGRHHKMLAQGLRYARWQEELRIDERRVKRRVERMLASQRPVLVGPWSGEVGFELLYWVPFVTWVLREAQVAPERVVVMSRGGPASWYAHLGGRYVDVFSQVSPDIFRARTEAQKKQRGVRAFDRDLIRHAITSARLERPILLHPSLMYRVFGPFWEQDATVHRIDEFTRYGRVSPPAVAALTGRLPASYVAVRFYFSSSFPDTPQNRAFAAATVRELAASTDAVMLGTGTRVDDHYDYAPDVSSRIHVVDDVMTSENNLDVQTAIIAGAKAFVGTYGGYAYLAPLCGVPSLGFYSVREAFHVYHLEVAERVIRRIGGGSLVALDVANAPLVRLALGAVPRDGVRAGSEAVHG